MSLTPAIILIVVAAIAGYVIGIVDSRLTATLRSKPENEPAAGQAPAKEQNSDGEHTVLKVTIDPALKWHLQLDGARLDDPNATSVEQRQRLVNVILQIRTWIDGKPAPAAESLPMPVPAPQPAALKPLTASTSALPPVTSDGKPLKIDAIRGLRSMLNSEVKSPDELKAASIVMMIDKILQTKLASSALDGKGIRLEDGAFGEVVVFVGARRYSDVASVPEPEVQAIIRAAIKEWEQK